MRMMMRAVVAAMAAMVMAACQHDISLRDDDSIGTLCVNGYIDASDTVAKLKVTRTDFNRPVGVAGAKVRMTVNGSLMSEATTVYGGCVLPYSLKAGDVVRIDVEDMGDHIWTEGVVPEAPRNVRGTVRVRDYCLTTTGHKKTDKNGIEAQVAFDDEGTSTDYYRVAMQMDWKVRSVIDTVSWLYYDAGWKEMKHYYYWDGERPENDVVETQMMWDRNVGEFYYPGVASLLDEETGTETDDIDFATARIENLYKVMNDRRFNGRECSMTLYKEAVKKLDVVNDWGLDFGTDRYAPTVVVNVDFTVYAMDEGQYFYLKVLNETSSDYFEDNEAVTGAMKLPSNVNGGSGNVFLTHSTTVQLGEVSYKGELHYVYEDRYLYDEGDWGYEE